MILRIRVLGVLFLFLAALQFSCKKEETTIPPTQAHFTNQTSSSYFVLNDPNSSFLVPIGVTTVSDQDRTVNFTVSSPTGAVAGTQYTIAGNSVVIPAKQATANITVKGLFAGFSGARVDTLIFTITGGDAAASTYNNVYKLVLRKFCDVTSAAITGSYTRSTDQYNGAASTKPNYTATISNFTSLTATSASIIIKNIGATSDNGWGPFGATDPVTTPGLTATLNWSNPANLTVTIPLQNYFNDGTGMSTISGTGTFSSCDNTFRIVCTVKYAGNGNSYNHTSLLNR